MTEFEIGAVVRLKSGGPKITVAGTAFNELPYVNAYPCVWFDSKGTKHDGVFESDALERDTSESATLVNLTSYK